MYRDSKPVDKNVDVGDKDLSGPRKSKKKNKSTPATQTPADGGRKSTESKSTDHRVSAMSRFINNTVTHKVKSVANSDRKSYPVKNSTATGQIGRASQWKHDRSSQASTLYDSDDDEESSDEFGRTDDSKKEGGIRNSSGTKATKARRSSNDASQRPPKSTVAKRSNDNQGGEPKKKGRKSTLAPRAKKTTAKSPSQMLKNKAKRKDVNDAKKIKEKEDLEAKLERVNSVIGATSDEHMLNMEDRYTTADKCDVIKIRSTTEGHGSAKPMTVIEFLRNTSNRFPIRPALTFKEEGSWKTITYGRLLSKVQTCACAFIKLGLKSGKSVALIGQNSKEWIIAYLATIFAGGIAVGLHEGMDQPTLQAILKETDTHSVLLSSDDSMRKVRGLRAKLPGFQHIIKYQGTVTHAPKIYSWTAFMEMGTSDKLTVLDTREQAMLPNMCCSIFYTSGTSGAQRGCMLSHDNLTWTAMRIAQLVKTVQYGAEEILSYLPLCHISAALIDIFIAVAIGANVTILPTSHDYRRLSDSLCLVRPTLFFGTPHVFERLKENLLHFSRQKGRLGKAFVKWARNVGITSNLLKLKGQMVPLAYYLAILLVYRSARKSVGLDRAKMIFVGVGLLSRKLIEFFMSFNIVIYQVYGLTECTGIETINLPWSFNPLSSGKVICASTALVSTKIKRASFGEVLIFGRNVCMGYVNKPAVTYAMMTDDGWLRTGDLGKFDKNGYLIVTARVEDLIVNTAGETIWPHIIEDQIMNLLPCLSHCVIVGHRRSYLIMLLTFKTVLDPLSNEPTDRLHPQALDWCRFVGSGATRVMHLINDRDLAVNKVIQATIAKFNKTVTPRSHCIQKWTILPRDFSTSGRELSYMLKLRRGVVMDKYEAIIQDFYMLGS